MKSDPIIEKIRNKLNESDPSKRSIEHIYQFNFTDIDGKPIKSVVFDLKGLQIFDGTVEASDVEITIKDDDFFLLGSKQISFEKLIKSGKVNINGDKAVLDKMIEKFKMNSQ